MTQPANPRSAGAGLAVIGLGASIAPLDFSVNVAFPAITAAFALETSAIRWVAVCYVLVYGSLMLGFGALGDRIGHLRVFRAGLALAALAFLLCALAPNYGALLAARMLQGVAVALTLSCAPALATALYDESRRTWALSAFGGMGALAGVVAPIVGGVSIAALGWPGVYWFRVPIVLVALLCVPLLRPALGVERARARAPFDLTGTCLLAGSVAMLLLVPALLRPGQGAVPTLPLAVGGACLMALFVRRQRTSSTPFMPHAVARDADFVLVNLASVMVQLTSFAVPLTVPYYLTRMAGWGPLASGTMLAVWAIGALAGSAVAARTVRALGARRAAFAAAWLSIAGLAGIALWPAAPAYALMLTCLLLQGLGIGLFQVAYTELVVAALPLSARGVAGSLTMVTRTVGIVIGASAWIWILQAVDAAGLAAGSAAQQPSWRHLARCTKLLRWRPARFSRSPACGLAPGSVRPAPDGRRQVAAVRPSRGRLKNAHPLPLQRISVHRIGRARHHSRGIAHEHHRTCRQAPRNGEPAGQRSACGSRNPQAFSLQAARQPGSRIRAGTAAPVAYPDLGRPAADPKRACATHRACRFPGGLGRCRPGTGRARTTWLATAAGWCVDPRRHPRDNAGCGRFRACAQCHRRSACGANPARCTCCTGARRKRRGGAGERRASACGGRHQTSRRGHRRLGASLVGARCRALPRLLCQ